MGPQRLRINQWGADNSFATDTKDEIRLGKGGVDDAEDGQVNTHEYGHAIHFSQNFDFGSSEPVAISEGFGDYWSVTITEVDAEQLGLPPLTDPACVADSEPPRTTDRSALPEARRLRPALPGEPHRGGARGRAHLVAGTVGHPECDRPREGGHGDPRGAVRLPRDDDDRARNPNGCRRLGALRQRTASRCARSSRPAGSSSSAFATGSDSSLTPCATFLNTPSRSRPSARLWKTSQRPSPRPSASRPRPSPRRRAAAARAGRPSRQPWPRRRPTSGRSPSGRTRRR